MANKHPLMDNNQWKFSQPEVGFRSHYVAVDNDTGKRTTMTLEASNTCREGLVSHTREVFQARLTNLKQINSDRVGWSERKHLWKATAGCDLVDPVGKKKESSLRIQWHKNWMNGWDDFPIDKFIKVCDVVVGPIAVLLGPDRPEGEWWRTDPLKAMKMVGDQQYVHWNGTDNWFLAHPATIGIATGLYRQCFHLCGAGVADQVIETLSEDEVSEVMTSNSQKLALLLVKKTRPWVEVPCAPGGYKVNYAFPLGLWRRLIRLQRAIRRFGYEESLGQGFHEGWDTTGVNKRYRGAYGFWGEEGELTEHHRHLMKIGAPRRETSGKAAKKAT